MNILSQVQEKLGKPYYDLEFLLNCLKETLTENGEADVAKFIPWINDNDNVDPLDLNEKHIQLHSLVFQLVNMVEINGAVQHRRHLEEENNMASVNGLWANSLKTLIDNKISEKEIAEVLEAVR